ncbi:BEL1-like homeodomain protein 4 [Macadamia integrifolia]|uniref:BEL1-like homeodomain protein 4 n=1 Tax=Macadamia integrifolia TaxID=60698 RepID=UPI001C4E6434|nr:BEL1-like homeodomain protein 4 [Macadamia integrifolia]
MPYGIESDRCFNQTTTSFEISLPGSSNFRVGSHVAQQSRREKLRVQQQFGNNPDVIQVRNVRSCDLLYDPPNYSTNTHCSLAQRDAMLQQGSSAHQNGRPVGTGDAPFSTHPVQSDFSPSVKVSDAHNPGYWKFFVPQQNCDWNVNYMNSLATSGCNQRPSFVGGILSGSVKENSIPSSTLNSVPASIGYEDVRSSLTNPSNVISDEESIKQFGEMQFGSPFYQNTLKEIETSTSIGRESFDMASFSQQKIREAGSWVDGGNELVLLPSNSDTNDGPGIAAAAVLMHKPVNGNHQLKSELGFFVKKMEGGVGTAASDSAAQGLSLTLSSHRPSDMLAVQLGGRFESENFQSQADAFISGSQDSKTSGYMCSSSKSPLSRASGSSIEGIVCSSTYARRSTGPLGPFTGYATILKCSKFLKPTQQLMDEFCDVMGPRFMRICETTEKGSRDVISSCDTTNAETEIDTRAGSSGVSSSPFYGSNEASGEGGSVSGPYQPYHPEFQQRKAKLLYMQEEVWRKYKQYHQQMQMVVSSFASVAGLSAATPYTSLALKAVSRHFRNLKNAISDQLQHINTAIGEDLSSPATDNSRGETIAPKLRFSDHGIRKHMSGGDSLGILQPQQHVWRPQRGLPEHSVAILRAWLFEHFLHPYPTDTDKEMLASQTGLTRNQVSNWFINARVRVWKPMVEEIHMLETKGSAKTNPNSSNNDGEPAIRNSSEPIGDHILDKLMVDAVSEKGSKCLGVVSMTNKEDDRTSQECNQGKRLRMESHFPAEVGGGLMGLMPYNQNRLIGGMGAVSLTLGLRHSAENARQLQHRQERQQEHQLIRHFGAQVMHDSVG